ncbi:MAG: 4-oxalocrotonate tautomerase DmpI [Selenomonadaceae bacterium]
MPVITVEAGRLNDEQKQELVTILTQKAASIMKVKEQHFVVLIKENIPENIGFGGAWLGNKK